MTDDQSSANAEPLLHRLRHALSLLPVGLIPADADPPLSLVQGAEWVQDWYNMDAELADLTYDSALEAELAARSGGVLRELTFVSDGWTIEMELDPGSRHVTVSGSVQPPIEGRAHLLVSGELFTGSMEPSGAFVIEDVPFGTVLAFIDTPHGRIRLGAFEV